MGSFFFHIGAFTLGDYGGKAPQESEQSVKMFEDSGAIILCVTTTPEVFVFNIFALCVQM